MQKTIFFAKSLKFNILSDKSVETSLHFQIKILVIMHFSKLQNENLKTLVKYAHIH